PPRLMFTAGLPNLPCSERTHSGALTWSGANGRAQGSSPDPAQTEPGSREKTCTESTGPARARPEQVLPNPAPPPGTAVPGAQCLRRGVEGHERDRLVGAAERVGASGQPAEQGLPGAGEPAALGGDGAAAPELPLRREWLIESDDDARPAVPHRFHQEARGD